MSRPQHPLLTRRAALTALCTLLIALSAVATFAAITPKQADAFCGFYISGAEGSLFNNATQVVLMRDGKRTVLSMQNHYDGPPEDFAMVVPVPVVLKEEDVKTLPHSVFQTVDTMASPRLVEYWEQDPCPAPYDHYPEEKMMMMAPAMGAAMMDSESQAEPSVRIEAQFEVGEYEVVILSANDSMALDTWLRAENYKIPPGAEPALRPYIESGMFFFVAKVNLKKVQREDGRAVLSPLRFHYDTDTFQLPVRLGLLNADGAQDLIIHVLARGQRYEVANYENVTIPTNIEVKAEARSGFGEFYAALFDATVAKHPKAVVTEYAWDAATCDPCPGPTIDPSQISLLGADVLANQDPWGFVLTRMHARYTAADLKDDLVFQAAAPIVGGREHLVEGGAIEKGSRSDSINNFQGRYIIRNPWQGAIACANPQRGVWGGPPGGGYDAPPISAKNTAFAPRGAALASYVNQNIDELGVEASDPPIIPPTAYLSSSSSNIHANCGRCAVRATPSTGGSSPLQALSALLFGLIAWRAARRRP